MSVTTLPTAAGAVDRAERDQVPERRAITRAAAGIGLYAAVFGLAFGAVAVGSGLTIIQTAALSAVMFTGASQFALVGILGGGGSAVAAVSAALLLGLRNAFYGVPVSQILRPSGLKRLYTAQFVIDETTAMAVSQRDRPAQRYAFWATGLMLFALWNLGTLAGALIGSSIDPSALGLDAAAPAIFLALLWPQLSRPRVQRTAALLPVAMLTALVVADLFDANGHYTFDWRTIAGVGAGGLAIRFERSLPVVLLAAIAVTAALRAIS